MIRIILTWVLFIPVAIINGIFRERLYRDMVGELAAHQISTAILSIAFIAVAYSMVGNIVSEADTFKLFAIGALWVIMTIVFEFGFGHYVDQVTLDKLLNDYNILKGRIWLIFLIVELCTPYIIKMIKR